MTGGVKQTGPSWSRWLQWLAPAEARKAGVVSVGYDPFTARLDRQSGEPSVLRKISRRFRLDTQVLEDRPMPLAGHGNGGIRLFQPQPAEIEHVCPGGGAAIDARVSGNCHDTGEYLGSNPVGRRSVYDRLQPFSVALMSSASVRNA
jgi:hypothetical protein